MLKYLFIIYSFTIVNTFACEDINEVNKNYKNNEIHIWIGNNSNFSKMFLKSKCAFERELEGVSLEKRKLIVKLISKSYESKEKNKNFSF